MIDIDSYEISLAIEVQIDAGSDLSNLRTRTLGQIDIERIGFRVIVKSHGSASSKFRSKKAL